MLRDIRCGPKCSWCWAYGLLVCAAVQELATEYQLFGDEPAEVEVADSLLRVGDCAAGVLTTRIDHLT